ncbi:hypothetical protein Afil01_31280 [Actinorhabdospora filicis]|uniref:AAA+ ATPase domain-containing protein n=1 Tax=Actinorhabdospora filicis TaxID=1785913 RepID=A0A9W6WA78_9ACTN|nr:AAA family ATPase [Actinorhabdospora filicis]GLZ78321.1 hypothetical protein Afil01_31280 [Actinorhabdospora filicis]
MSTGPRHPGDLQRDILAALADRDGRAATVAELHTDVGATSAGAVLQSLKRLRQAGRVETVAGRRPIRWRLTGAPPSAPAVAAPILRPNGRLYHPRALADGSDVDVLARMRSHGVPVLLYGPPGTGKTALVEAAFPDLVTIAGDGDTAVADFTGEYTQEPDGTYRFVHGPLVTAMREGRVLFIDDATLIAPSVLAVLYPAMDGRGEITVKAHTGETIKAADGFYVIAGHNPGVAGAILTEALSSRFAVHIEVTSDWDLAERLGVPQQAITVAMNLAANAASGAIGWSPQLRELLAVKKVTETLGLDAALANLVAVAPAIDRPLVAEVVSRVTGRTIRPLALGPQLPAAPPPVR